MIYEQLKYWYRKYLKNFVRKYSPKKIKKIIFVLKFVPQLSTVTSLLWELKNDTPMSQLTWASSFNIDSDSKLISKSIEYIKNANLINLEHDLKFKTGAKIQYQFEYENMNNFPGEHYRILVSIINTNNFKKVTEIGTGSGIASKVILNSTNAIIDTFDIASWDENNSHLTFAEINSPRLKMHVENLGENKIFEKNVNLLLNSNLIFLDANKDGNFEDKFLEQLSNLSFDGEYRLLFLDDIRFHTMYRIWTNILSPKIDLTSFGHWTGSGLIDITNGLLYKNEK